MPRCHPVHCHPVHCYAVKCVDDYASDCDPVENKLARNKNDHKNATTANIVHGKSGILKHLVAEKIVAGSVIDLSKKKSSSSSSKSKNKTKPPKSPSNASKKSTSSTKKPKKSSS